ncbi:carbon-nitrogen hydrolase family protein [Ethanoligenens harbinense]|uniref:Nitrilase/cyanide hydratase and apolipoprotein N-acyltransferase n=1 Tax=Ethanoligenens harbinense (strain DSM 18485 / JCM 12961 / CGMCC 1.5033 / YUAN-3) TaxID=663278 RepID=E6U4V7_ETHHY|nr:carbon-nitrogen hydrolase family protein [Ethanoligenens harbinense]ADU27842.1 Nitrilase/cyanide hydratase and apolipoprotein N-acyltransferase [Ethanoligenens harbinense YUAN-3]AVQ96864.1 carbon-nitrogen hydrolase family protein [Ethanoligenens harbinense YUAN-3]AYF39526.1 carbon-nitrogen hydrolase family protein [Ethanoligenens harbinense]AYF42351.1 carbon-nitrogen hydrolase family protein [Ethanoligenens harbinense]
MKDICTVSVVTFHPAWGDKKANLKRIMEYIECAAKKGSDIVVLPEMALTGYDDEGDKPRKEKMQVRLAEAVPGPSTEKVAELTKRLGIYAVMGMPIRDDNDPETVYNGLAVFSPDGLAGSYHKIHLPPPEPNWATRGDRPYILETAWGPVGIAICYDNYSFPELMRYYVSKGCRLIVNSTALAHCHGPYYGPATLEAAIVQNGIYIASANLGGLDVENYFWGGSSILGPGQKHTWSYYYYAGRKFTDKDAPEIEMFTATIDLSLASRYPYQFNPAVNGTDWRPDKYIEFFKDTLSNPNDGK